MFTVYILEDEEGKLYKGMSSNFQRRFSEHKRGKTITTRKMNGLKLIYCEKYDNFDEARKREKYFKTAVGRRFIKKK